MDTTFLYKLGNRCGNYRFKTQKHFLYFTERPIIIIIIVEVESHRIIKISVHRS